MDLYIYYHAAPGQAESVQAAVARLQAKLRMADRPKAPVCGLKRRPRTADAGAPDTWMEIYRDVPDGFPAQLEAAVAGSDLPRLVDGSRHVEIFVDALPCA